MAKFSATIYSWRIEIADNGAVSVFDKETLCPNSKEALNEIARQVGFTMDASWTTRQAGRKLVDFLNSGTASAQSVPEPSQTPEASKIEEPRPRSQKAEEPKTKPTPAEGFTASERESASAKVRVYGKAQNRTALGIAHAYMVMYPHSTLEDLRKAFPNSLNPDAGVKENFIPAEEKGTTFDWNGYFRGEDEILTTGDGRKVAMVSMWTRPSFERIVAHARLYDIVVAQFEVADKGGKKGGFRLEYLNGYIPPVPEKKRSRWWLWLILVVILAAVAAFFALRRPEVVEVEKIVEVEKVVYVDRVEELEKNFNAAQFEQGKADLSDDAKFVLHDLAKVMEKYPEMKLRIVGHTSAEGDPDFNLKLSEARAQAAVDFLVGRGISADRLTAEGKGSSQPVDADHPEANRRTEFIVIE